MGSRVWGLVPLAYTGRSLLGVECKVPSWLACTKWVQKEQLAVDTFWQLGSKSGPL